MCDRTGLNMQACKHKLKCKFLAKNICALSHVDDTFKHESLYNEVMERMVKIEKQVAQNKNENEK